MSLQKIKTRIEAAEVKEGRPPNSVSLIAVSKVQPNERVRLVLDQGHRTFGENRVQEAAGKWPAFREEFEGVELHLIGPLQTNKVGLAMDLFDTIHSLDREKLARKIANESQKQGQCPSLLVQVNTGEEPQKAGVLPTDVNDFVSVCRHMDLPVSGLMCIPPIDEEPSLHFALLAKYAEDNGLPNLSMGMSADFETAISLGATHVRIGSAIFGERVRAD